VRSNTPTSWPVRDTVSAAFWLGQTYDYYLARHGRNSIDGNKGTIAAAPDGKRGIKPAALPAESGN